MRCVQDTDKRRKSSDIRKFIVQVEEPSKGNAFVTYSR